MDKRELVRRLYAAIFFIIGIFLILAVVLAIGMEKGLTQPKFQIRVLFREVGGLSVGAPVRLSGVNIGTVGKIDFADEKIDNRGVEVTLNLFRRYRRELEKSSSFAIKTEGILGQKIVEISVKGSASGIDLNKPIIGVDPLDVQDLAESFGETAVSLKETSQAIDLIIKELQYSSKTFKRILDRIEQRIIEGSLFKVF